MKNVPKLKRGMLWCISVNSSLFGVCAKSHTHLQSYVLDEEGNISACAYCATATSLCHMVLLHSAVSVHLNVNWQHFETVLECYIITWTYMGDICGNGEILWLVQSCISLPSLAVFFAPQDEMMLRWWLFWGCHMIFTFLIDCCMIFSCNMQLYFNFYHC